METKTFRLALKTATHRPLEAKEFLNDKRLTQQEKIVLTNFLLLRDFKNQDILDALEAMTCQDPLVEAVRTFCIGTALINQTRCKEGDPFLLRSLALNQVPEGRNIKRMTLQTLFVSYVNQKLLSKAHEAILALEAMGISSSEEEDYLRLNHLTLDVLCQRHDEARAQITYLEKRYAELPELCRITFLIDRFDLAVAQQDLDEAAQILERMKPLRKFKNVSMMLLLRALLDYLRHGKELYLYEKDFTEAPYQRAYLKCLLALEKNDLPNAHGAWKLLQEYHPENFQEPFRYVGPTTLFGLCLEKLTKFEEPKVIEFSADMPLEDKLFALLSTGRPVPKGELYEVLYGTHLDNKDDLRKLAVLVHRLKTSKALEIKSVKGSYQLLTRPEADRKIS